MGQPHKLTIHHALEDVFTCNYCLVSSKLWYQIDAERFSIVLGEDDAFLQGSSKRQACARVVGLGDFLSFNDARRLPISITDRVLVPHSKEAACFVPATVLRQIDMQGSDSEVQYLVAQHHGELSMVEGHRIVHISASRYESAVQSMLDSKCLLPSPNTSPHRLTTVLSSSAGAEFSLPASTPDCSTTGRDGQDAITPLVPTELTGTGLSPLGPSALHGEEPSHEQTTLARQKVIICVSIRFTKLALFFFCWTYSMCFFPGFTLCFMNADLVFYKEKLKDPLWLLL